MAIKITDAKFLKSCPSTKQLPPLPYPEFAFLGRSNVGKSSFINMLAGRKDLVKTGARPGVTVAVNIFILNGKMSFADLPGFGYAKLPRSIRNTLVPLIRDYVTVRESLRLAFLLVDVRRVPDENERGYIELLSRRRIPVAIALTKCDKLSRAQKLRAVREIAAALEVESHALFCTSAKTGEGRKEILDLIEEYGGGKQD